MRYGSHCCFVAGAAAADITRLAVAGYIRDGLAAHDRILCVLGQTDDSWLTQALHSARTPVEERVADGSLVIVDMSQTPTWQGEFSPVDAAQMMFDAISSAQDDGHTGLRVCSDMSWSRRHRVPHRALVEMERLIEAGLRTRAGMGLCIYDPEQSTMAQIEEHARQHGLRAGPGAQRAPSLQVLHTSTGLRLIGEADLTVRELLDNALSQAAARIGQDIVIDLSSLAFADVSALDAMFQAANRLHAGRQLVLRSATPTMRKAMTILGWDTSAAIRHEPPRASGGTP
jgi:anti-anti-sigma factor